MSKIVANVEHQAKGKKANIFGFIFSIIAEIIGFCFSHTHISSYGREWSIRWYYFYLYFTDIDYKNKTLFWKKSWDFNIAMILIVVCLFLPQIIIAIKRGICDKQASLTSLYVDADKIYGSFGSFSKKEMVIPIEQLDNVIVTDALADKIRSGKTLTLCSASGKIKFHFIQNADEVSSAILAMINDYKKNYGNVAKQTVIENTIQTSNADELKKYKELLDSGVITQEEFDAKKKQILGL